MSENEKEESEEGVIHLPDPITLCSYFTKTGIGLAALIGTLSLGPIDLARTSYNTIVGDIPYIRTEAIEYVRNNIHLENPDYSSRQVEKTLARVLNYNLADSEQVNPQNVRMKEIWDATEEYSSGLYDRFVWPRIGD